MYQYPLTFTFPILAVTPQFDATDAAGKSLFSASKKLLSSKDEISVVAKGRTYFKVISQENRITDIPSNWDVMTGDGKIFGIVDDDYMSAIDTSKFIQNSAAQMMMEMEISRALNLKALKMYWIKNTAGEQIGLIAPDKYSLYAGQLPLYHIIRKLPFFFRFITPRYYIRLRDETMMFLEKKRSFLKDTYVLHKRGNFTDQDEPLLLNSVILAVLYERERLKELYT